MFALVLLASQVFLATGLVVDTIQNNSDGSESFDELAYNG